MAAGSHAKPAPPRPAPTPHLLTVDDSQDVTRQQPESVAAVLKVFAILQALSEQKDIGISELSVRLAMPKATVYRFMQTMMTLGYVHRQADSECYGLTMSRRRLPAATSRRGWAARISLCRIARTDTALRMVPP